MKSRTASLLRLAAAGIKYLLLRVVVLVGFFCKALLVAWCSLALHFSNLLAMGAHLDGAGVSRSQRLGAVAAAG